MKKDSLTSCPPVVVVGLGVTGLGVVRSLNERSVPMKISITGMDSDVRQPGVRTRLCDKFFCEDINSDSLVEHLLQLRKRFSADPILFLSRDVHVLAVLRHVDQLKEHYHFLLPDADVSELLLNKARFFAYAQENGFNIPATFRVSTIEDMQTATASIRFPCILKPCYRTSRWHKRGYPKQFVFNDKNDLLRVWSSVRLIQSDYILQELVGGNESQSYFCMVYYDEESRCIESFTGRKLRHWPCKSGNACVAAPTSCPAVEKETKRLFGALQFKGFGSAEFKHDHRTGEYKILEATVGRTNLQSELATANGINLVWKAYANLTRATVEQEAKPREPTIWIYEYGDLRSCIQHVRRSELTLGEWIRSYKGRRCYALFSWKDPLPLLISLRKAIAQSLRVGTGLGRAQERVMALGTEFS